MDPATAILLLSPFPVELDRHVAVLPSLWMPVVLPLDGVPTDTRTAWLLADRSAPLEKRVEAALNAGKLEVAWILVLEPTTPVVGLVEMPLNRWAAGELARLGLPAPSGPILALSADSNDCQRLQTVVGTALTDVSDYLPLRWPRWTGPLLVISSDSPIDPAPGRSRLARPVLPVLRIANPEIGAVAGDITRLALDLTSPPADGWPAWLRIGLVTLAEAHARGQGLGPLHSRTVRQRAGADGLAELFLSRNPDPELAAALCAPCINPARRAAFKNLLDLLRNGTSAQGAFSIAYGWNAEELLTIR